MDRLQSMRVFMRVADLGAFTKAAAQMELSNAVVTRHIADLESKLGTRLLHRTTRSLSLTEPGQVYLERVRQILDEIDEVERSIVERSQEPIGTLRIAAPVVFGLHNLAPVLARYKERFPRVVPDLSLIDRQVDLVEEGYDLGIMVMRQMRGASVVTRRLVVGRMVVCAAPGHIARYGRPERPEHLAEHAHLALPSAYDGDERRFTGPDGEARVRLTPVMIADNAEMLRRLALTGTGIAILPNYLVDEDIAAGRLIRLLPQYRLPAIEINVAYPSRRHMPAKVRTFIDHLVDHFSGVAGDEAGDADGRVASSVTACAKADGRFVAQS